MLASFRTWLTAAAMWAVIGPLCALAAIAVASAFAVLIAVLFDLDGLKEIGSDIAKWSTIGVFAWMALCVAAAYGVDAMTDCYRLIFARNNRQSRDGSKRTVA